jgi:hypothetical protein
VEQELLTIPKHLSSSPVFSVVRVSFMCMFCRSLFVLLAIVLSVLLRFTDSDYLPLVSSNSSCPFVLFLSVIVLSVLFRFTDSDYLPLVSSNSSCPFVLFLLAIVLSVLLRFTDSDYLPLVSSNSLLNTITITLQFENKECRAEIKLTD